MNLNQDHSQKQEPREPSRDAERSEVRPEKAPDLSGALLPAAQHEKLQKPEGETPVSKEKQKAETQPAIQTKTETTTDADTATKENKRAGFHPRVYKDPEPSPTLIKLLGPLNRWVNLTGAPILRNIASLIRAIPYSNRIPGVRTLNRALGGILQFQRIDFPEADKKAMKEAVNPGTAAFLGPNHPEFFTDWMIDKHVCMEVSPLVANWATWTIVNGNKYTQKFWLKNNLIANVSNGGGKEFSESWAKKGHGVLLHPEGTVHWMGRKIGYIFPGIVDMAVETAKQLAAEGSNRPVYIVPFVSRHNFTRDVSYELNREMKHIEKKLSLPSGKGQSVEGRFYNIQNNILEKQMEKFEHTPDPAVGTDFFSRQDSFYRSLKTRMEAEFGAQAGDELKQIHRFEKANRDQNRQENPEAYKTNQKVIDELRRLTGFTPEVYGGPTLSQEDIAESLKRIMRDLVTKSFVDGIKNMIPLPIAERDAHIRTVKPIRVDLLLKERPDEEEAVSEELWKQVGDSLQSRLDELNEELEPVVSRFEKDNPFVS